MSDEMQKRRKLSQDALIKSQDAVQHGLRRGADELLRLGAEALQAARTPRVSSLRLTTCTLRCSTDCAHTMRRPA